MEPCVPPAQSLSPREAGLTQQWEVRSLNSPSLWLLALGVILARASEGKGPQASFASEEFPSGVGGWFWAGLGLG